MTATVRHGAPYRHPWLETFERDPVSGFADFLAGYASIHPYDRADAPDAARMLFAHLPADDPARLALDGAVLACLEQRRKGLVPTIPSKLQRFIAETAEAFEIVASLDLVDAATILRRRFVVWNEWVAGLVLSPARDVRAAYWRMLALTQPLMQDSAEGANLVHLEPLWHRICREAGGALPPHYLEIGLLGLRRLPSSADSSAPWLTGLAQWALANDPSDAAFKAVWLPLKSLYPRPAKTWRKLVGELLQSAAFGDVDAPGWWRCDRDFDPLGRPEGRHGMHALRSPSPEACQEVIDHLQPELARSRGAIDTLINGHRRFLEATGASQYFVRAIHKLGTAMLRMTGPDREAYCRAAEALVREGLGWEPGNRHLWSLWRESLEARGAVEAAELLAWERIRRDPGDPPARNQLALLLARLPGRQADAERLLVETIERFPGDAVARTQLAELLIAGNRLDDARAVVDATIAAGAIDAITWAISARLWSQAGDRDRALRAIAHGLAIDAGNPFLQRFDAELRAGRTLPLVSAGLHNAAPVAVADAMAGVDAVLPEGVGLRGRLRRLRFQAERGEQEVAMAEIRHVLAEAPGFTYAALLAARQGEWHAADDSLPGFAVAFEAALAAEDRARLETLAQRFPRLEALTWVARAVLGDDKARELVQDWLDRDGSEAPAVSGLKAQLRPLLRMIEGGATDLVHHRTAIMPRLRDANEATLDDYLAAA